MSADDPYADGRLYDLEYAHHREDIAWYVLRARRAGGPVLELGCGTGRLTLPMGRAGVPVTGIDRAPGMLATLREKLANESDAVRARIRIQEADYRTSILEHPDAAYVAALWPFNALHHCADADEVRRLLAELHRCVQPGGLLALDGYLPDLDLYDRDPDARYEPRTFDDPRTGEPLESWEQGWWDAETHTHHVLYVYRHPDGREERVHLRLRMFAVEELRHLLATTGWTLVQEASDFVGTPVESSSLKWVATALRS